MISDDDVEKIRKALKPDFDKLSTKSDLNQLRQDTKSDLNQMENNIKGYVHEGVNAVVDGVDNLLQEYQFDSRIKKLEKIHPGGRHRQID